MPLAPSVRRIVAETNVDPAGIEGTGRGGRLTKGDVLAHLAGPRGRPPPRSRPRRLLEPRRPRRPPALARRRKRMSGLRQKIAQRLVEAQHTAAILTTFNEADMSQVMDLRAKYKDSFKTKHGVGLGFMSFFVKATIEALKAFPNVNGRIDGTDIVTNHAYDIGVAVSTERGPDGPGDPRRRQAELRRDREGDRRLRRQGPRGDDLRHRPPGRHVHDHQRRRLRLAALDADPQPAPERHPRDARDPEAARSPSTTRSSSGR